MSFLTVALGGAVGSAGRYAISLIPIRTPFPAQTFITNVLGAILIGFIAGIASTRESSSQNEVLFWKTGVCGGFTTFSTFSLEAYSLLESKAYVMGAAYIVLSVACCIAGVMIGMKLAATIR